MDTTRSTQRSINKPWGDTNKSPQEKNVHLTNTNKTHGRISEAVEMAIESLCYRSGCRASYMVDKQYELSIHILAQSHQTKIPLQTLHDIQSLRIARSDSKSNLLSINPVHYVVLQHPRRQRCQRRRRTTARKRKGQHQKHGVPSSGSRVQDG